ncbi:protein POLAR [Pyrus ussuriensis x Pyrus communis]|uniref:Protein POLAR n=1 Tax=Pyrus ussuriensis x Pyrus communis TaxID=2448454 RepID=A0A5N5I3Z4_9ROSA|nr:protein POLAR [Pyrus ussuriensis x Pyrus communis]
MRALAFDHNAEPLRPVLNNPSVSPVFQSHLPSWEISDFEEQRERMIFRFSSKATSVRVEIGNRFSLKKRTGLKKKKEAEKDEERWRGGERITHASFPLFMRWYLSLSL